MLNKPGETEIEMYVRFPDELSAAEKKEIEEEINRDESLRLLAQWFREFYQKSDSIPAQTTSIRHRPSAIELTSMPARRKKTTHRFVLAAQTVASGKKTFRTINTFISEEHQTLIRILKDESKQTVSIHVISRYLDKDDVLLVKMPNEKSHYLIQNRGKLEFPYRKGFREKAGDWDQCTLSFPVLKTRIQDIEKLADGFIPVKTRRGLQALEVVQEKNRVVIDISGNADLPDGCRLMVVKYDEACTVWPVVNNKVSIPSEHLKNRKPELFFFE
jgi:hypothetical protein